MGRNLFGSCGLIVAIGLACQPADAGDRKSAGRVHDEAKAMFVAREAHAVSLRYETPGATFATFFRISRSDSGILVVALELPTAGGSPRGFFGHVPALRKESRLTQL